jgi:hypothetical protein
VSIRPFLNGFLLGVAISTNALGTRNITHYSYFGAFRSDVSNVGPNAAMLTQDGELTDIGSWYMGGAATNNVPEASGASVMGAASGAFTLTLVAMVWSYLA